MNDTTSSTTDKVFCVATTIAKPEYVEQVRQALEDLIAPVRQEKGMIQYDLFRDPQDSRRFVFMECWETMEDFRAHCEAPHVKVYLERSATWLEHAEFHALEKVR